MPASLQREVSQTCETIFSGGPATSILPGQSHKGVFPATAPSQLPQVGSWEPDHCSDTPAQGGIRSLATPESLLLLAGKSSLLGIGPVGWENPLPACPGKPSGRGSPHLWPPPAPPSQASTAGQCFGEQAPSPHGWKWEITKNLDVFQGHQRTNFIPENFTDSYIHVI